MRLPIHILGLVFINIGVALGMISDNGPGNSSVLHDGLMTKEVQLNKIAQADSLYAEREFEKAAEIYASYAKGESGDEATIILKTAKAYAQAGDFNKGAKYLEGYLILNEDYRFDRAPEFRKIQHTDQFIELLKRYRTNMNAWALAFLYIGLIGFFLFAVINLNRSGDRKANLLISLLVLFYSITMVQIGLMISNYRLYFPHILFASAAFSFIYGPLVYFYLKKVCTTYIFKPLDLLHALPFLFYILYFLEYYTLSGNEKILVMINYQPVKFYTFRIILKELSLFIYGIAIIRLLRKYKKQTPGQLAEQKKWLNLVVVFYLIYVFCYLLYLIIITVPNEYLSFEKSSFTISISMAMGFPILYIGYLAYTQPLIFSGEYLLKDILKMKYKKSGLTKRYSRELMTDLMQLMEDGKLYRGSDVSLDLLSEKLNTTRHNTSQVINEHFKLNFHEFINKYRIEEAKQILEQDSHENLNVVEVGYEVGYNSKSTFFAKFKKATGMTPSEYRRTLRVV